jgi:hypothetical protein
VSDSLSLQIAGLEFEIIPNSDFAVVVEDPLYREFIDRATTEADLRVPVELGINDPRPDPDWPVVFDSGESWLAHRDRENVVISFRSPAEPDGFWWRASLEGTEPRVTLCFNPDQVDRAASPPRLANPLQYPLDQLLTMLILADRGGCIVHAAGIAREGRGIAFVGRSGAGKSTLMRLLEDREDFACLSDDRLIIRIIDGQPRIFGTPWAGEGLVASNLAADLSAVVFLHQHEENALHHIDPSAAVSQLLPTTSIPWFDEPRMSGCLAVIDEVVRTTPAYDLHFRPEPAVADLLAHLF